MKINLINHYMFFLIVALTIPLSLRAQSPARPAIGVSGFILQAEYQFGTAEGNNIKSLADLQSNFTPDAPWGRINGELQHFVNFLPTAWRGVKPDPEAAARTHQFEEEALVLNSNHLGGPYKYGRIESGAIVTNATVKYPVIVEVMAKLPKGRAHWPSIWMYDFNSGKHGSEEIDIMESQRNTADGTRDTRRHVYQNTHGKYTKVQNFLMDKHNRYDAGVDLSEDYHTYSCHWFANGDVDMYVDGNRTVRRNIPWAAGGDPNIIIFMPTGSDKMDWTGPIVDNSKDGTDTFTPDDPNSTFKIRHIRIFKPVGTPAPDEKRQTE